MHVEVRILVPVSSEEIDQHRGDLLAAIEENIDQAIIDEQSIAGDSLTWTYDSKQEYDEADTPGTPLYRFHRGEAWPA